MLPSLDNQYVLMNLKYEINDLEVDNAKVKIDNAKTFNVKHFEREGNTKIEFGKKVSKADEKKILDETIRDDKAKEKEDDKLLKDGKMTKADHDKKQKELEQGIKNSQNEEKKLKVLLLI